MDHPGRQPVRTRRSSPRAVARRLALALAAAGALFAGSAQAQLYERFADARWLDADGEQVALDAFRGRLVVMTMAYTACRKTCSSSMLVLREIQDILSHRGVDATVIVVSYDPQRDSAAEWQRYRSARKLPDSWHFLSGESGPTRQLAAWLDLGFWSYDDHVMHDFGIVVFDANGRRQRRIGWDDAAHLERALGPG